MFTITSAEIRWFIKGQIPSSVFDWFNGLNENYVNQPERTDYYLVLKSDDALGIKLREGKVEINNPNPANISNKSQVLFLLNQALFLFMSVMNRLPFNSNSFVLRHV